MTVLKNYVKRLQKFREVKYFCKWQDLPSLKCLAWGVLRGVSAEDRLLGVGGDTPTIKSYISGSDEINDSFKKEVLKNEVK